MNSAAHLPARPPEGDEEQIQLLERLCNASAISGDEGAVRRIVLESVRPALRRDRDDVKVDALGNVLVTRRGQGEDRWRVMLAAHMDEVGFMLTEDQGDGFFRFEKVGGVDVRQAAGKPVWVGREGVPGVIGAKAIHLMEANERKSGVSLDDLRIDVGPANKGKVKIGDGATFATRFARLGPSFRAKALDDRLGVAALIELVKHAPPNVDLLAAFTVQEEVGLRGAKVAAYALDPQLAIVLDCTPANDLPDWSEGGGDTEAPGTHENTRYNTRLGLGPALYTADQGTLSDPRLVRHFVRTAQARQIPLQFRQPGGGRTDAGAIHTQRAGIPSISISVPGRYLHTPASIVRSADWENLLALVHATLVDLPKDFFAVER